MDSERIETIAAGWLAKRDAEAWSEADEAAFQDWQSQSVAHRVAVIRLKTIWLHADRLQALGAGVPAGKVPPPGQWRISSFGLTRAANSDGRAGKGLAQPRRRVLAACAALLVLAAGAAAYFQFHEPGVYRTDVGRTEAVNLPDGSHVLLNTDSRIYVALDESERRIELDRGEAFFDVAKDTARPFVVQAANKRIVAVGTRFSVFRSGQDVRVVVTEGRVRLEDIRRVGDKAPVQLAAGSVAQTGAAGVLVRETTVENAEKYVSWRSGYIAFHDTPLAEAVAQFNRYHTRKLVIADPSLADLRIGGNLRTTNIQAFVRVLEQGFPVRARAEADRIVLTAR